MPTFHITAPDGTAYEVNGPDGSTEAQALAQVRAQHAPAATGMVDSGVRSAANAATFNLADPIAAAMDATLPGVNTALSKIGLAQAPSNAATWSQRYAEDRAQQQGITHADQSAHPVASFAGAVGGGMLNPVARAMGIPSSFAGALGQGAILGGGYGAGSAVATGDDMRGALGDTALGALTGAATSGLLHGAGLLLKGGKQTADAALLNKKGVPTTIGQDLGGGYKRAEDAMTSMPYGGDAIIARQKEGIQGFNRAMENETASPIFQSVPQAVKSGNDAQAWLGAKNGAAYDAAWNGASIPANQIPQLIQDTANATNHFPNGMQGVAKDVQNDIADRLLSNVDPNTGDISGKGLVDAKNWFAEQSRVSSNAGQDEINRAAAYGNVLKSIKGHVAQADPNRGALLNAADAMFAKRMALVDAAKNTASSMKDGIVMPSQMSAAMRSNDTSLHGLDYVLGKIPGQDIVQAGQRTLPSSVPDSGTAIRRLVTGGIPALAGAGVGLGVAGLPGVAAAGLPLLLMRGLYSKAGQSAAKAAIFGAPQTRAALANVLPAAAPGAIALSSSR